MNLMASAALVSASMCGRAATDVVTLHGVVVDSAGTAVPGASIAVYRDAAVIAQQTTDASGAFAFDAVPREYHLVIMASGFEELHSSPIPFSAKGVSRFTLWHSGQIVDYAPASLVKSATSGSGWEYGALAQGGVGAEDRSSYKFLSLGGHAGKVLTPNLGSGMLQGSFEYAVEVFPFWQSYTPYFQKVSCVSTTSTPPNSGYVCSQPYTVGGTYTGVSVTPIILRWNFTHGERWMPWIQGAGGVVWTNHKYPPIGNTNLADIASNGPSGDTSVWNFTPQFGIGTHYFLKPRRSLDFSVNAVHISSASLGDKNPGVNASVQFSVGYTWWK